MAETIINSGELNLDPGIQGNDSNLIIDSINHRGWGRQKFLLSYPTQTVGLGLH